MESRLQLTMKPVCIRALMISDRTFQYSSHLPHYHRSALPSLRELSVFIEKLCSSVCTSAPRNTIRLFCQVIFPLPKSTQDHLFHVLLFRFQFLFERKREEEKRRLLIPPPLLFLLLLRRVFTSDISFDCVCGPEFCPTRSSLFISSRVIFS